MFNFCERGLWSSLSEFHKVKVVVHGATGHIPTPNTPRKHSLHWTQTTTMQRQGRLSSQAGNTPLSLFDQTLPKLCQYCQPSPTPILPKIPLMNKNDVTSIYSPNPDFVTLPCCPKAPVQCPISFIFSVLIQSKFIYCKLARKTYLTAFPGFKLRKLITGPLVQLSR